MRAVLLLAALLALTLAAPAGAAFSGSNGKIAYVTKTGGLVVDDPFDELPAGPPIAQASIGGQNAMAPQSPPQWSPDGTKLLFTKAIDNGSLPPKHTAVFVINRDGSGERQVTSPFPGRPASCGECEDGESAWDTQPVWRDDDTIAFIRWVGADDHAAHVAQEGTTVRRIGIGGGGESVLRHYPNEDQSAAMSVIWPTGWTQPLVVYADSTGYSLRRTSSDQPLATALGITDVDASPDGERIVYAGPTTAGYRVTTITASGQPVNTFDPGFEAPPWVRFTPDANGVLMPGCAADRDGVQHCGLVTHRLPDPDADVKPGEPEEAPYLDLSIPSIAQPFLPGQRSAIDIQSQDLPVIYLPGFLGSEIQCDGDRVWMPTLPPLRFAKMRLQADGVSNATCATARPTGKVADSFLFSDIYGHANEWMEALKAPGGSLAYGWDWRKAPQETLAKLDGKITELLATPLALAQDATRVSMVGHSYGALLMRTYVDDPARSRRVARMLTVGAPYWGSPKPLFGVAFGIELPGPSVIDAMADNEDMASFTRNAAGVYHLFPSDNYGPWLRYEGDQLDQAGVANWVATGAQGNKTLLEQAWAHHRDNIDGFLDYGGRIDYRSVTGVGELTIGGVDIIDLAAGGAGLSARVRYENGDGTVTARSATQGPVGTTDPLGDDIHIQYRCGFAHMDQTKDELLQAAYSDFLVSGRIPRKLAAADCTPEGEEIEIFDDLEVVAAPAAPRRRASGPMTLAEAEAANLADVVRLPGRTLIVRNDAHPVDLTFEAEGVGFGISRIEGETRGPQRTVAPVSGTVVLGADGAVTVDGIPVTPVTGGAGTPGGPAGGGTTGQPDAGAGGGPGGGPRHCPSLAKATRALKRAKAAQRRHPTAKNRRRVAKARSARAKAAACRR